MSPQNFSLIYLYVLYSKCHPFLFMNKRRGTPARAAPGIVKGSNGYGGGQIHVWKEEENRELKRGRG